jgi:hypothetical protein
MLLLWSNALVIKDDDQIRLQEYERN